jgi:hypothetical protein
MTKFAQFASTLSSGQEFVGSKGASVAGVGDPGPAAAVSDRGYNFACLRCATRKQLA